MPSIKPILSITNSQRRRLLERIVLRTEGQPPRISGSAMQRGEEGMLPSLEGGVPIGETLPAAPGFPLPPYLRGAERSIRGGGGDIERYAGTNYRSPEQSMIDSIRAQSMGSAQTELPLTSSKYTAGPTTRQDKWKASQLMRGQAWPMPTAAKAPGGGAVTLSKGGGAGQAPSPVDQVMRTQPETERLMGRLNVKGGGVDTGKPAFRDYPLIEAKMRYRQHPELYAPGGVPSPVKTLSAELPRSLNELTGRGAGKYERLKFKSVETSLERKARTTLPHAAKKEASLDEIITTAEKLEEYWKFIGGKRGKAGKAWEMLRQGSSGRHKVKDTKDYFIRSGLRWRDDPEKFTKQWPREARILEGLWGEIEKAVVGGVK